MLYNKGNTRTPLLSSIGSRTKYTNSVEFVLSQTYTSEDGDIPNISETDSLTAPNPSYITRNQATNVTQIFQDALAISYAKMSNMGTLSGVNIAGQKANPLIELDFQIARKMNKLGRAIEKTFIQGTFNKATADDEVNKTRGLNQAIETNVIAANGKPLDIWLLNDLLIEMKSNGADITNLIAWLDTVTINQINGSAVENGLTVAPATRNENGINIRRIELPSGVVTIANGEFIPAGTAFLLNLAELAPVEQPVPAKGNFFLEPLAKTGAGEKYQIFGQIGLDYGAEHLHGKITGLSTEFVAPEGKKVVVVSKPATDDDDGV